MSINIVGDDELDIIELQNKMVIKIDYSAGTNMWGWRGRITGEYRRVRLFDENNDLISETIEKNPSYHPIEYPEPPEMVIY